MTTAPSETAPTATPLATFWRNLFPWEQLNAKNLPDHWLELGTEIVPVMAVMVASGGPLPALLSTDDHGRLQVSDAPYDWSNFSDPGVGVIALVSVSAKPGARLVLDTLVIGLSDNVGAADNKRVSVYDGTFAVGTLLAPFRVGITNAPSATDHISLTGLKITGTPGTKMEIGFSTVGVSQAQTIFAAGYFRQEQM